MSTRKKRQPLITFLAIVLIVGIIAMGCVYAFTGVTVYSCEDYSTVTAKDKDAADVTVSSISKKAGRLSFTLAGPAAVIDVKFDFFVNDWKDEGIRMIIVDLVDMTTNGTFNKIKMYIGDGTNEVYIGSVGDVGATTNYEVVYEDLDDTLSDGGNVHFILKTYDEAGALVNAWSLGDQEMALDFSRGGGYQTVTGMVATGVISIIGAFKKAISGITGAIGGFITALVTNEVIIIFAVGVALVAVWYLFGPKKGYKKVTR